jgi:hypothetical protein
MAVLDSVERHQPLHQTRYVCRRTQAHRKDDVALGAAPGRRRSGNASQRVRGQVGQGRAVRSVASGRSAMVSNTNGSSIPWPAPSRWLSRPKG